MSTPTEKIHKPLSGLEVVEAVCAEVRRALLNTGQFDAHTTVINAQWQGGFKVSGYLRRPVVVRVEGSVSAGGAAALVAEGAEAFQTDAAVVHEPRQPEDVRRKTAETVAEAERVRAEAAQSAAEVPAAVAAVAAGTETPQEPASEGTQAVQDAPESAVGVTGAAPPVETPAPAPAPPVSDASETSKKGQKGQKGRK